MPFTTISRVLSYSLPQTSHWFIKKARLPSGELRLGTLVAFEAGLCGLFHQILLCFIHAFFNQFLGGCSLVPHRNCRCLATLRAWFWIQTFFFRNVFGSRPDYAGFFAFSAGQLTARLLEIRVQDVFSGAAVDYRQFTGALSQDFAGDCPQPAPVFDYFSLIHWILFHLCNFSSCTLQVSTAQGNGVKAPSASVTGSNLRGYDGLVGLVASPRRTVT